MKNLQLSNQKRNIMNLAWNFFRQTGKSFSMCLKKAWANVKLHEKLRKGIERFYFQKVDGTIREAWGTLSGVENRVKSDRRSSNPTVQVYFDTEKQEFRCFKKFNLVTM